VASRDLFGLDRYPMPDEQRRDLAETLAAAHAALDRLENTVATWDGKPLPSDRTEFYGIGAAIRGVEQYAVRAMKTAGDALLWVVEDGAPSVVKPRFPAMVPPKQPRR